MNTQFMPDATHLERMQVMIDAAEAVRNEEYYADLTPEVLDQKNEQFSLNAIELNKIELKKKEAVDAFKVQMKPLEIIYGTLLEEITMKKEKRTGKLFDMKDSENSMMLTYDELGELVASRRLRPEEKGRSRMFVPEGGIKGKIVNE